MGPWFLRDKRLPFRPGCSFEVLKRQIQAGKVTANTVLRGPTTRQFWAVARHVPGVAHLLGLCHKCGAKVQPTDKHCSSCDAVFKEPAQRNELGLIFPTADAAQTAQRELDEEVAALTAPVKERSAGDGGKSGSSGKAKKPGEDLLQEVLGTPPSGPSRASRSESPKSGKSPAVAAPVAAAPQALDFTPGPDEAAPPRMNPTTVLLITLNAILMLALLLVFWWVSRG
jgi:hypothetical protein